MENATADPADFAARAERIRRRILSLGKIADDYVRDRLLDAAEYLRYAAADLRVGLLSDGRDRLELAERIISEATASAAPEPPSIDDEIDSRRELEQLRRDEEADAEYYRRLETGGTDAQ